MLLVSILPWVIGDVLEREVSRHPTSLFDQQFGFGMLNDDLNQPRFLIPLRSGGYYRPWRQHSNRESGLSNIVNDNDAFRVNLDVQQFRPDEITVKTVDKYLVVEGKHEEREDEHGFVTRSFQRRYLLPGNVESEAIKSSLSSDGVLTIAAPKMQQAFANERVIQIVQTGTPAVKVGEKMLNAKGDAKENQKTEQSK